jgi:hypothetical protein
MKDLGAVSFYLGMQVERDREKGLCRVHQESYLLKVAERFHLVSARPVGVPMQPGVVLSKRSAQTVTGQEDMSQVPYCSAVGAVLYAALCTRPDVAYATGILSRFSGCPSRQHWEALKRVIRYLRGTAEQGLQFDKSQGLTLEAYSDADFSSCPDSRKSISGQALLLAGAAVDWKSKKQPIVAQSTTEAEYVAMAEAAKSVVWTRELLGELGVGGRQATVLYCDNESAVALALDPVHHERTKHIKRRFHFIREVVMRRELLLQFCPSEDQLADVFTKPLSRERFCRLSEQIGMRS